MKPETKRIVYHVVNSLLAGLLVLVGNFANGEFTWRGLALAGCAAVAVAVIQIKNFIDTLDSENDKQCNTPNNLGCFIAC